MRPPVQREARRSHLQPCPRCGEANGVTAVGTPGHSIGHTSYVVSSGGKSVYVQSDVCNNIHVFAPYPDWHGFFDQDPPKAAATRRRVYDMLAAEKMPVQGYHFPFPALVHVEKSGSGYRLVPVAWNPVL